MNNTTIYKFTSSTCGPCRMLGPVWNKVIVKPEFSEITFKEYILDKDSESMEYFKKYDVRSLPTIIIEQDNEIKETILGTKSEKVLTDTFKKYV